MALHMLEYAYAGMEGTDEEEGPTQRAVPACDTTMEASAAHTHAYTTRQARLRNDTGRRRVWQATGTRRAREREMR